MTHGDFKQTAQAALVQRCDYDMGGLYRKRERTQASGDLYRCTNKRHSPLQKPTVRAFIYE